MIDRNKHIKTIGKTKVGCKRKRTHDVIVENWHTESHEFGSRLYKLTMALATESEFNDLDVIPYVSNDGHMLCKDIGD